MNETRKEIAKWLRLLLILEIAGLILSLTGLVGLDLGSVRQWISRLLTAGIIYALFQLGAGRYRTSAVLKTICLAVTVAIALAGPVYVHLVTTGAGEKAELYSKITGAISTVMLVVSWVATWQLYNAHADLVKEADATLEKRWRQLFWVSLLVAVPVSVVSAVLAWLVQDGTLGSDLYGVLNILLMSLPQRLVEALMIFYLYRTVKVLEKE
jgi:DNA-binding transcriptional ArsR family regulator